MKWCKTKMAIQTVCFRRTTLRTPQLLLMKAQKYNNLDLNYHRWLESFETRVSNLFLRCPLEKGTSNCDTLICQSSDIRRTKSLNTGPLQRLHRSPQRTDCHSQSRFKLPENDCRQKMQTCTIKLYNLLMTKSSNATKQAQMIYERKNSP